MTRVGFLGLGQMGGPMASHAISAGHDVALYDPAPTALEERLTPTSRAASTPADAATGAEVVCVVVRDDAQSIQSITGLDGVLDGVAPGAVVVLHATVAPVTVRTVADACRSHDVQFVDAGISGGAAGAAAGTLYVMCGGDPAAIDTARPVLDAYSRHVVRFGEVGAGMAAKLARNLMHYQVWVAAFEAMALAEAAGLDPRAFEHLCQESGVADAVALQLGQASTQPVDPTRDPEHAALLHKIVTLGWKDLDDAIALANDVGALEGIAMAEATRRRYGPSMHLDIAPAD